MSRRRKHGSGRENIRKLIRTSNYSYCVTIPKAYIEKLGWRERQKVVVELVGDEIIIQDWQENSE